MLLYEVDMSMDCYSTKSKGYICYIIFKLTKFQVELVLMDFTFMITYGNIFIMMSQSKTISQVNPSFLVYN